MRFDFRPQLAAAVAVLLTGAIAAAINTRQPAPNFSATTLDGQKYTNSTLRGKVVLRR
jgi:hypothetical protein